MQTHPVLLRAFRSPLVLASILILLVNDHLLKAAMPSWLTGKLSDFAGLFFFPFVLGVALEWLAGAARRMRGKGDASPSPSAALLAAMVVSGGLFTAVKTLPAVNVLVVDLLSRVTGLPGQMVLDPTDLAALVMLWPAWKLWQRLERAPAPRRGRSNRWAYAALAAASLAALASDCPPPTGITRIVEQDGVLYAGGPYDAGYSITTSFYASQDGGRTWSESADRVPEAVKVRLDGKTILPYTVCTDDNQHCYQIGAGPAEEPVIYGTTNGGDELSPAWQIPAGRYDYMKRARVSLSCEVAPDRKVFDLLLMDGASGIVLLAAMGNEGILRYEEGGAWERIGVGTGDIQPTPFAAANLQEALGNTDEFFLGLIAGVIAFILVSSLAWQQIMRLPRKANLPAERTMRWALQPVLYLLGWFGLIALFVILLMASVDEVTFFSPFILPLTPVFLIIALVQVWMRVGELTAFPNLPGRMAGAAVLSAFGVFFAGWLPFLLWVMGVIRRYSTASVISIVLMVAALGAGGWAIVRAARSADRDGGKDEQKQPETRAAAQQQVE